MKANNIKQWAALLLTVSGMAALPLTVTAAAGDNKVVTSSTTESNQTYRSNDTSQAALQVSGNGVTYTGTNITLTGTAETGNGRYGAHVYNRGRLDLYGGSATATGNVSGGASAIRVDGTSIANLYNVNISVMSGHGIALSNSSTAAVIGGTITTGGDIDQHCGIYLTGSSFARLENLTINVTDINNARGFGVWGNADSAVSGSGLTIITQGSRGYGLSIGDAAMMTIDSSTINTSGSAAMGVMVNTSRDGAASAMWLNDVDITTTGEEAHGLCEGYSPNIGSTAIYATNVRVNTSGAGAAAVYLFSRPDGLQILEIDGGSYTAADGAGLHIANTDQTNFSNEYQITIKGGATISGTVALLVEESGANPQTNVTVNVTDNSSLNGGITTTGSTNTTVNLDNSTVTGDVNSSGSSTLTITGSNGTTISGTANAKDNANINVNISGPGSSWLGDVNQEGDSKIVINLDNGATGTGGFNGGDLTVGGGSEWKFDKDSHVNNGKNDGTLDIGDHNVKFDNLENNGKIVINVNTDSGTPKGSLSTDNGSGNGTIVINPGGNGTGNPDDILNGVVNGPGTDGWQWEDIDWGLKQYEVTPNPDGSLTIREIGKSSTVSALTQGLLAAQKSSWFAQQNSLLKRMGDLRLNAERTTNISGKEDKDISAPMPTADALISNIWIRSYGAQYNYGSSVTGRGFKQYTYGVDLGTDHKWSLNADHDLYTGVFAGYGRADTDHRYNGSESNLNNYYAGLYASLLNNSGWYIDATLKAQYSDHELSGYHGGIDYFSAKYHNWSLGGSIEIGKKFTFQDDWFIEPQLQANYLHILAEDYSVSTGQQLTVSDLDAVQLRAGLVMGRTLKLRNGGALQPYVKLSGVEMLSTGGNIKSGYQSQRPNLDGARAELGGGIIWQVDANNQLHLDYEASFGDKYDKPWGLTAGYRYQF